MKKIFATLLLLVFTSNIVSFAGEAIVIRSDGQIAKKSNLTLSNVDNSKKEYKSMHHNEIDIKNITFDDKFLNKYTNKFNKYSTPIKRSSIFLNELEDYKQYNYPQKDNFNTNDKSIIRVELQDGDYAILNTDAKWNEKYKYAAEYHKDGSLFGIVQIKTIKKTRESATIAFYEYRIWRDGVGGLFGDLKHILFLDFEKKKDKINIAQFIYDKKICIDKLLCCQINNEIYLNDESKNLIVKMKKFEIPTPIKDGETLNETKEVIHEVIIVPLMIIGAIIIAPIAILLLNSLNIDFKTHG